MKRLVSVLSLVVFLGISGLSASVDSVKTESKFTQANSNFLFGTNAKNLNVQVLSQKELEETKGMLAPIFWGIGYGFASGFIDPIATDYWNNRPINWGGAFHSGLKGAAWGIAGAGIAKHLLKIR